MCCIEISDTTTRKWKLGEEEAWEARRANLPTAADAPWRIHPRTGYPIQEYRTANGIKKVIDFGGPRQPQPARVSNGRQPIGHNTGTILGLDRLPENGGQQGPRSTAGTDYGTRIEPGTRVQTGGRAPADRGGQRGRGAQPAGDAPLEEEVLNLAFDVGSGSGSNQSTRSGRTASTRHTAATNHPRHYQRHGSTRHSIRSGY